MNHTLLDNGLTEYSQILNFAFNSKKTKSLLFSLCKISQHHQLDNDGKLTINSGNQKVERFEQYKLLGIVTEKPFELYMHVRNFCKIAILL